MGKSSSAPKYATTTYDTGGLFGSSTSGASGTSYKPTDSISNVGTNAWSGLNNALQGINSTDYSNDANFQAYQNQLNKTAQQAYDANVLSPLANRGLMRSSGLQAATRYTRRGCRFLIPISIQIYPNNESFPRLPPA